MEKFICICNKYTKNSYPFHWLPGAGEVKEIERGGSGCQDFLGFGEALHDNYSAHEDESSSKLVFWESSHLYLTFQGICLIVCESDDCCNLTNIQEEKLMLQRVYRTIVAGGCLLLATVAQGFAADYEHTIEAKDISFSWKIDGDKLAGKIAAKTDGWVGVGFNPSEKMKDANFVLGYVKDGETQLIDEYGTTATGHKNDEDLGGKTDVTLVGGTEEGGMTTIEFVMRR